jgi:hypothetical protein
MRKGYIVMAEGILEALCSTGDLEWAKRRAEIYNTTPEHDINARVYEVVEQDFADPTYYGDYILLEVSE